MSDVIVTGGAGFLGSFVVKELERRDYEVFVPLHDDYDLRFPIDIQRMFNDAHANYVVHLAAKVGGIGANRAKPAEFFYDNMKMGMEVLHHAYLAGIEKFVMVGTTCSYPRDTSVPFKEEEIWNGYPEPTNAPYGIAKRALLAMCQAYRAQYDFNAIYVVPANLYGPRDSFDPKTSHVIPAIIRKCVEAVENGEEVVRLWGSGKPTRDFLYVEDAACGIVNAFQLYREPEPLNLGSGTEISICDLAEHVGRLTGFRGSFIWDTSQPDGQPRRCLDTQNAQWYLGWRAEVGLEEGLKRTIEWYQRLRRKR